MKAVEVDRLSKSYGSKQALNNVSFSLEAGRTLGLLGPNGAGKTTLVEILCGLRTANAGQVRILGFNPSSGGKHFKERIGVVLQVGGVEPEMKLYEVLRLFRSYYPKGHPPDNLIQQVGLMAERRTKIKNLSGGQLRRVMFVLALVGDPELLFLDEPTSGFDPEARQLSWGLIDQMKHSGKTILLTTHDLHEAERLADTIIILNNGSVLAEGQPKKIAEKCVGESQLSFKHPSAARDEDFPWSGRFQRFANGEVSLSSDRPEDDLRSILEWAARKGYELENLSVRPSSFEEAYFKLVGRRDEDQ